MDLPVLKDCPSVRVGMDCAGIGMSSGHPTAMHVLLQVRDPLLRDAMIAVARMDCVVSIAVKNDGRDSQPVPQDRRSLARPGRSGEVTVPPGGERRAEVLCAAAGEL